jgi:hypothetical protein
VEDGVKIKILFQQRYILFVYIIRHVVGFLYRPLNGLDCPGFESQGQDSFLCSKTSRRSLWPTQPPIQSVSRYFPGGGGAVKQPGREVNNSLPSNADVKNDWRCTSTPPLRLRDMDRSNFRRICVTDLRYITFEMSIISKHRYMIFLCRNAEC